MLYIIIIIIIKIVVSDVLLPFNINYADIKHQVYILCNIE